MPTPPSYTRSTTFVGGTSGSSPATWGALRGVIYNRTLSGSPIASIGSNTVDFDQGFKTAAGNGFIRTEGGPLYLGYAGSGPNFNAYVTSGGSGTSAKFSSDYETAPLGWIVNEDRAQAIGETVTLSTGSITMAASAFVSPFQGFTASGTPTINSIGKLTAF